jgi:hypothetical protein
MSSVSRWRSRSTCIAVEVICAIRVSSVLVISDRIGAQQEQPEDEQPDPDHRIAVAADEDPVEQRLQAP